MMELNAKKFGLAGGILWGASLLLLAVAGMFGFKSGFVALFSSEYIGFEASAAGALIGFVWGFVDGFIGCFIFAWLYNCLLKGCSCKKGKGKK